MEWLRRRRARKAAEETLRHARHLRSMREDVIGEGDLRELDVRRVALGAAIRGGSLDAIAGESEALNACMARLAPQRPHHALRENLEVLAVALTVAMAFRTYFVQPFKIPTGSMEPTLCGIRAEPADAPSWTDRMPLKLAKWAITGKWYREVRVAIPGVVGPPRMGGADRPASCFYDVGSRRYEVPKSAVLLVKPGQYAGRGDLLWAGYVVTGDHVFVDKMRWNFVRPRRGQVVVFGTDRIAGIGQDTHYIKRLIGLPTEKVAIRPPDVLINGQPLRQPEQIARIARRDPKYPQGYRLALAGPMDPALLTDPDRSIDLGTQGYFVLGDNTSNSKDGRYWGCVPQPEMVGPAFLVYWPFSRRWGTLR